MTPREHLAPSGFSFKLEPTQPLPIIEGCFSETPLAYLRRHKPSFQYATIALLEQAPDAQKSSLLVKVRRLHVITVSAASTAITPSYLRGRVVRGQPLPEVSLAPPTADLTDQDEEGDRKLRTMLAFIVGMEGGFEGQSMPPDVFRVVLHMLMPSWDPLRRGVSADGGALYPKYEL